MSRTYKTRPRWVKLNDPSSDTIECHEHFAVRREKSGRMVTEERYNWKTGTREPMEVPHYYVWVEAVPCTIDMPELPWRDERHKYSNPDRKRCDKRFVWERGCSCCSRRGYKSATNSAKRAKIKQATKKAINSYGRSVDTDPLSHDVWLEGCGDEGPVQEFTTDRPNWWDVDIQVDSKYDSNYWWD